MKESNKDWALKALDDYIKELEYELYVEYTRLDEIEDIEKTDLTVKHELTDKIAELTRITNKILKM